MAVTLEEWRLALLLEPTGTGLSIRLWASRLLPLQPLSFPCHHRPDGWQRRQPGGSLHRELGRIGDRLASLDRHGRRLGNSQHQWFGKL